MTIRFAFTLPLIAVLLGGPVASDRAWAVTPAEWVQSTEAQFAKGEFKDAAVTSRGEIVLSRQAELVMTSDDAPAVVSAVATDGKAIYAASGCTPVVYRIADGEASALAELHGAMVGSLLWTPKGLLAGTCGDKAGIYRIAADGQTQAIWTDPDVKYVWAIVPGPDGTLYAATGPAGAVYEIDPAKPDHAVRVYEADEKLAKNILCLAVAKGKVYAGTDGSGLVIEIDPEARSGRVVLDAEEKEIAAIVADDAGGLYVATSDISKAGPDGGGAPNGTKQGKALPATATNEAPTQPAAASASSDQPASAPATAPANNAANAAVAMAQRAARAAKANDPKGKPSGPGNHVYYIAPDGLVRPIFRKPVTILAMLMQGQRLILGTGNGGQIYSLSLDGDQVVQLVDTDAKQVTSLAPADGGQILFATANKGSVAKLTGTFAQRGTYLSKPLDAGQIAHWGTLAARASQGGGKVTVATRSGNVADPDEATWSDFSAEQAVDGEFLSIGSPSARFLQYRLTLTGDGKATPMAQDVRVVYQVGNLAPVVAGVVVKPSAKAPNKGNGNAKGPKVFRIVAIQAKDPNKDKLVWSVSFRQDGTKSWIQIAEKLDKPMYVWDTRTVGDGTYELRATVSDSPSNPPAAALSSDRVSEPVMVDNTPPAVGDLAVEPAAGAKGKVSVAGAITDASRIVSIAYSVDSQDDWVAVLPIDGICDSSSEKVRFEIDKLKPGAHRVAVRAEDLYGNVGYAAVTVTLGK